MQTELYLGLDIGTSGVRGVVVNRQGSALADSRVGLPASVRLGARCEQTPEHWWQALTRVFEQLGHQVELSHIAALAVDGTSGTLLLTAADGRPLTSALMYNDARATAESDRLSRVAPAVSAAHGASSGLAKLLHLLPDHPNAVYALHQADWISGRLCGHFGMSDENNALKLGYDVVLRRWPDWLVGEDSCLGINPDLLPQVLPPGSPLATISPKVATAFGLSPKTRVLAGTTDSVAAFLASGARQIGDAVTSLGSTLVLKVISEVPVFDPAHGIYSHRLGGMWLAGGASNSGGAVLRQFFSDEQMLAMTPRLNPHQPGNYDYYPLPAPGERFPINDPAYPPNIQPRSEDDATFFQALLEGIARIECDGYRLLTQLGAPYPSSIRSLGGGAKNMAWQQIRRRQVGVPMLPAEHQEAAFGAALLARGLDG